MCSDVIYLCVQNSYIRLFSYELNVNRCADARVLVARLGLLFEPEWNLKFGIYLSTRVSKGRLKGNENGILRELGAEQQYPVLSVCLSVCLSAC